ncbi:MAG: endonuclease/exonuclease/phosphatase family protein [Pedosphaera sp.]|nr:endonuclease/exonuclease/phosphatase family protein [Pedosphaera sp.]
MIKGASKGCCVIIALFCLAQISASGADTFSVATYNLENYIDAAAGTRPAKPAVAKAKIRESIRALHPQVLALQEIGGTNALLELRASLKAEGFDYPFWEHVSGFDTNIYVAVLSQFPIVARRSHTREGFLLGGRRFRVSRGFAEIDIQVNPRYAFTLITAHLKSRRPVAVADEAELREQEALVLRETIVARLKINPDANLVVLGDFNDVKDSRAIRIVLGRGKTALTDTRPAEKNGDDTSNPTPRYPPRNITWTHHYGKEDSYSRIDYILVSRGMAREWKTNGTYVLALPNWGIASDHRPIVASFAAEEK